MQPICTADQSKYRRSKESEKADQLANSQRGLTLVWEGDTIPGSRRSDQSGFWYYARLRYVPT